MLKGSLEWSKTVKTLGRNCAITWTANKFCKDWKPILDIASFW